MELLKPNKSNGAEEKEETNTYVGFILLSSAQCDWMQWKTFLKMDWGINCKDEIKDDMIVFESEGMRVACSLMLTPVPNNEAEENAKNNFLWPEAVETVKQHKAHILLAVMGAEDAVEQRKLFTKVAASFLKLDNALAIYQYPTVLSADYYIDSAESLREGMLPVLNWIYIGIYPDQNTFCGYTYGLRNFGKDEIEVIQSKAVPSDLYSFLVDTASYVMEYDAVLKDGQTIGFSEEEKLSVTLSKGVAVEGNSLKIGFETV